MTDTMELQAGPASGPVGFIKSIYEKLELISKPGLVDLAARVWVGGIFWKSARTKVVGGWDVTSWELSSGAVYLFENEYNVPLLSPTVAAWAAIIGEHLFPILLILGLGARLGALGLLGMTAVIQIFVYPNLWPDHLLWATVLLYIAAGGPGKLSLDHLIARKLSN